MRIARIGTVGSAARHLIEIVLSDFFAIEARPALPTPHQIAVVLGDSTRTSPGDLHRFARDVLALGAVAIVVGGRGARRLEDVFDEAIVFAEVEAATPESKVVLTTSHGDDPEEALEFGLAHAFPPADYEDGCRTIVVYVVGTDDPRIDAALADPDAFLERRFALDG